MRRTLNILGLATLLAGIVTTTPASAAFAPLPASGAQVNGTFGQIIATRPPRVIQFSLRLDF